MANDLVPSEERFSREALERIIHRAAELQAAQREIGDQLSEDDVLDLGKQVGIPANLLQRAMYEERARAVTQTQGGLGRLTGPARISAQRTVRGTPTVIEEKLGYWMTEMELLTVKRRFPDSTSWEPRRDWMTAVKRGLGVGGRRYALSRPKEVLGRVQGLEEGWSHVTLVADLSNVRNERLAGGGLAVGAGVTIGGIGMVLGVASVVASLPVAVGIAGGWALARSHRGQVERVQVALEQVLDKLEHDEIAVPPKSSAGQSPDIVKRITSELRDISKHFRRDIAVAAGTLTP